MGQKGSPSDITLPLVGSDARYEWLGRVQFPEEQENGHQEQVFQAVVEHHGVPIPFDIREFHRPGDLGDTADDLAVYEIPQSSQAHYERSGQDKFVRQGEKFLSMQPTE